MEFRYLRGVAPPGRANAVAYDISGVKPGTHLAIPSPALTLIVDLGDGLTLTGPNLDGRATFGVAIAGMHMDPYIVHHAGLQRGLQITLPPSLLGSITGVPASELVGQTVELATLDHCLAERLHQAVAGARPEHRERAGAEVLRAAAQLRRDVDPDAAATWALLARTRGQISVSEVVRTSGWSSRYLGSRFHAEFGLTIKQAARLVRFHTVRADLDAGVAAADVAARAGYSDQAHLSRDVRAFLGMPPTAYLAVREAEFTTV